MYGMTTTKGCQWWKRGTIGCLGKGFYVGPIGYTRAVNSPLAQGAGEGLVESSLGAMFAQSVRGFVIPLRPYVSTQFSQNKHTRHRNDGFAIRLVIPFATHPGHIVDV